MTEFLESIEVIRKLNISPQELEKLGADGHLSFVTEGGRVRYKKSDVDLFYAGMAFGAERLSNAVLAFLKIGELGEGADDTNT
jgi:hypothetical protein